MVEWLKGAWWSGGRVYGRVEQITGVAAGGEDGERQ